VDLVQLAQPAPDRRRPLVRLALFAFCGGLLLLLSSRPAGSLLAPVESALVPVGSALVPAAGAVGGLVSPVVPGGLPPLPGLPGSGTGSRGGPWGQGSRRRLDRR